MSDDRRENIPLTRMRTSSAKKMRQPAAMAMSAGVPSSAKKMRQPAAMAVSAGMRQPAAMSNPPPAVMRQFSSNASSCSDSNPTLKAGTDMCSDAETGLTPPLVRMRQSASVPRPAPQMRMLQPAAVPSSSSSSASAKNAPLLRMRQSAAISSSSSSSASSCLDSNPTLKAGTDMYSDAEKDLDVCGPCYSKMTPHARKIIGNLVPHSISSRGRPPHEITCDFCSKTVDEFVCEATFEAAVGEETVFGKHP